VAKQEVFGRDHGARGEESREGSDYAASGVDHRATLGRLVLWVQSRRARAPPTARVASLRRTPVEADAMRHAGLEVRRASRSYRGMRSPTAGEAPVRPHADGHLHRVRLEAVGPDDQAHYFRQAAGPETFTYVRDAIAREKHPRDGGVIERLR
jgi:hypothetical protein